MKLVFTYILISLLVYFSNSYAIQGRWTSDKYPNVILQVADFKTDPDGTNFYELSVNSCPFVYDIRIDQSYMTILNLDQKKEKVSSNCTLPNSQILSQQIEQKIFYFYINYNKLGLVSIFGNKTNVFTRLTKNTTNNYLTGQYRDIVTGEIVVFRNDTVYLCSDTLEAGYLANYEKEFELNISSVINNYCQSKGNNAQKVLQIMGQATNYRFENQNILTFYNLGRPTLRLKFVQKAVQPPKSNSDNKNTASNITQTNNSANLSQTDIKIIDLKTQNKNATNENNFSIPLTINPTSNSTNQPSNQKPKANETVQSSSVQTNQKYSSSSSTTTATSSSTSATNSSSSSSNSTSSSTTSSTLSSSLSQSKHESSAVSTSSITTAQNSKNIQNSIINTTTTLSSSQSSTSTSSSVSTATSSTSSSTVITAPINDNIKIQAQTVNQPITYTSIQGRQPYTGIEIKNQNSIGVWNVEYFDSPEVENWPGKIKINGTYLILQGCNTISIPIRMNSTTQKIIASPTGIISTRKACGNVDQVYIDALIKANRFEPVRNSTSIMLNFYYNDQLLCSMSRNFNQGEAQSIRDVSKTSPTQSSVSIQTTNSQIINSQTKTNNLLNSIQTTSSITSITSNIPIPNTTSKPSQTTNYLPSTTTNKPPTTSSTPPSNNLLLIGKYFPNSLYQLNLPPALGRKYTYTFNPSSVSVVGTCNSYKYLYTLQQQTDSYAFSADQSSKIQQKPIGATCDPTQDALYLRILFQAKSIQQSSAGGVTKLNLLNGSGKVIAVLQKHVTN